jgi:hypothetical protein
VLHVVDDGAELVIEVETSPALVGEDVPSSVELRWRPRDFSGGYLPIIALG